MNARDREMFAWVRAFNPYDLYSKAESRPDVARLRPFYESRPDVARLRPFYEDRIAGFLPPALSW